MSTTPPYIDEDREAMPVRPFVPRFLNDVELRQFFGLSERALARLRYTKRFPARDELVGKTDRKAVDHFFDRRSGIADAIGVTQFVDGVENWD